MRSRMFSRLASLIVVGATLIVACQQAVPSPTMPAPSPTPAAPSATLAAPSPIPAAPEPTEVPKEPTVVILGQRYEINNIDPARATFDDPTSAAMDGLYDSLVMFEGDPPKPVPMLAEKWEVSDDLKEWTFNIDRRAVFHDGSAVTADAVKWTWDRMLTLQKGMSFQWAALDKESLSVVDDYTVHFTLEEPSAPFLSTLRFLKILNPAIVRAHKLAGEFGEEGDYGETWLIDHDAGSGPFTIERWEPGVEYVFAATPNYWHGWPNEKHADVIVFKLIRELKSAQIAMRTGVADMTFAADANPEFLQLANDPNLVVRAVPTFLGWMFMMNNQRGPTADVNVRKAISYAFDYEGFLPSVVAAEMPQSPLPKGLLHFVPQDMPKFDLEKAKAYLAKSPWPNGGFELDVVYVSSFPMEEEASLVLLEGLRELNITLNLVPKTWSEMTQMCADPETAADLGIYGVPGRAEDDPDSFLRATYDSGSWGSWRACHYYKNEQVEDLLDAGAREADSEARARIYAEVQELIAADQPVLFFAQGGLISVHNRRVGGTDYASLGPAQSYTPWMSYVYVEGE